MRAVLALSALLLSAFPARGLEPYLVKDVNPEVEPAGSLPRNFVAAGSVALFGAGDGVSGRELWRSDGTGDGTSQVADLCPGSCSGDPRPYASAGRLSFFSAVEDPDSGRSFFVTDGTAAGTVRLTGPEVEPVCCAAWVAGMTGEGVLYFPARDAAHGLELWRTDGTAAGTRLVADLRPGPAGSGVSSLTPFRGNLYFAADDGRQGGALWKTDGTRAGTVPVLDPDPSSANPRPVAAGIVRGRLLFTQRTPGRGRALWASDGTPRGTAPITTPGALSVLDLVVQGDRAFFLAGEGPRGEELWATDGTAPGTRRISNLARRDAFRTDDGFLLGLSRTDPGLGGRFLFRARTGTLGIEPWVTDGTLEGTRLLRDLCPGPCDGVRGIWSKALPGRAFLDGFDEEGCAVWVTDGTGAGTRRLGSLCARGGLYSLGSRLVFGVTDASGVPRSNLWATDGTPANTRLITGFAADRVGEEGRVLGDRLLFDAPGPEGDELWRTDGTAAGTRLVRDINPVVAGQGSVPSSLMARNGEAVFFALTAGGRELWRSDGTEEGTVRVRAFGPDEWDGVPPEGPTEQTAGQLFFLLDRDGQPRLWRTDGTEAGTDPLLAEGVRLSRDWPRMRAAGATVFFPAEDADHGFELWASDGTAAGTRLVRDVEPGPAGSLVDPGFGFAGELAAFAGKLYFTAATSAQGAELWTSDGTAAGTVLVKDIDPAAGSYPNLFTVHAGRLWFFAHDGVHGWALWASDGTGAGTVLAVDPELGADSWAADAMVSLGDRLLISGGSPAAGEGLWVSDGTPAGTRRIDGEPVSGERWAVFAGRLYYGAGEGGRRLRVSDGTESGTAPLLDRDGHGIADPVEFAVLDGHLLFVTDDGQGRGRLWQSDGTPAGTFPLMPVSDLLAARGDRLVRAGSRVFFSASSPENGAEPWAVDEGHP